jgi:hypothetical protein
MDSVESNPVETQPAELSDLAKAMLGAATEETQTEEQPTPPETETPEAEQVETADDVEAVPETEAIAPKNVKELAEKLGISAKDLYDNLEVNGKSLGTIKDEMQNYDALTTTRDELDTRRVEFDTKMTQQVQEVTAVAEIMGMDRLTPAEKQQVQGVLQQRKDREVKALLISTPEWSDTVTRTADVASMVADVAPFNLSEADLGLIEDHRLIRYIRHQALKNARDVKEPKALPKGQRPTGSKRKPRDDPKTIVSEAKSGQRDQRTALGDVLRAQG